VGLNMPSHNFNGDTFVAFVDISGFKELLKQDNRAWKALDRFYQLGYNILRKLNSQNKASKVEGIFISDCGVLFVRGDILAIEKLAMLLKVIESLNKGMIQDEYMLMTSIAYGHFRYEKRIEFRGIEKNPVYGNAYISAYSDNEEGKPRIQPGQCRIVAANLPDEAMQAMNDRDADICIKKIRKEGIKHYYFYWNVRTPAMIDEFKKKYSNVYNLKYKGMIESLKEE